MLLMLLVGGLAMSLALAYMAIQGLRGVPDAIGRTTSKGVAIACVILANAVFVGTIVIYLQMSQPIVVNLYR